MTKGSDTDGDVRANDLSLTAARPARLCGCVTSAVRDESSPPGSRSAVGGIRSFSFVRGAGAHPPESPLNFTPRTCWTVLAFLSPSPLRACTSACPNQVANARVDMAWPASTGRVTPPGGVPHGGGVGVFG